MIILKSILELKKSHPLFEKSLLLEHMFQCERLKMETVDLLAEYLLMLMDLYKRTINWQTGMGPQNFQINLFFAFC